MELKIIFDMRKITGKIPMINELIFAILFIYFRIIYPYPMIQMVSYSDHFFLVRLAFCLCYWLGWIWTWHIINLFIKALSELYPNSTQLRKLYQSVKTLRPYAFILHIASFIITTKGVFLKELGQ